MKDGFTLVEVVISVAIAATLAGGVHATLVATRVAAERQADGAREARGRARAHEILRFDYRGRLKLAAEAPGPGSPEESRIRIETTAEALGGLERALRQVRYTASPKGLVREEAGVGVLLTARPVRFEWRERGLWIPLPGASPQALRVVFQDPPEEVILR